MTYIAEIKFWDEYESAYVRTKSFVTADNFKIAIDKMMQYYGEDVIEKFSLEPFSPDDFLEFRVDSVKEGQLFENIREVLGERVIW